MKICTSIEQYELDGFRRRWPRLAEWKGKDVAELLVGVLLQRYLYTPWFSDSEIDGVLDVLQCEDSYERKE